MMPKSLILGELAFTVSVVCSIYKKTKRKTVNFITYIKVNSAETSSIRASFHVIHSGHCYGKMSNPLMKQQQFSWAAGPQREGLQSQLCPGLLIRLCCLLVVPVCPQIFSTSASKEKKQTHRSDTTDTQTTPAHCRERA